MLFHKDMKEILDNLSCLDHLTDKQLWSEDKALRDSWIDWGWTVERVSCGGKLFPVGSERFKPMREADELRNLSVELNGPEESKDRDAEVQLRWARGGWRTGPQWKNEGSKQPERKSR